MTPVANPRLAFFVAVSRNGVIGRDGGLPWRLPSDLKRFKAMTMGKPIVMGRKTWESLPRKPLPGRENIVITRQAGYTADGAHVVNSADAALALAADFGSDEIAVIGGAEIFNLLMPKADRIYLTDVDVDVPGDTFFSSFDPSQWHEAEREAHAQGPGDSAPFVIRTLDRIRV